jgi:CDP-glucose 4,6-dehydratase
MDWRGKRILVTGADGFIGSKLAGRLSELGATCIVYDIVRRLDVLDYPTLQLYIENNEADYVFHLAAQAHVPIANKYPYNTLETNIMGTLNILDICSDLNTPCIIASSDKAYGEATTDYTVDTPLNAKYPYDVSKACADKISQIYIDRGFPVKIMRLCNVYGPGDTHRHRLIPHVISSYLKGGVPTLRGDPNMVREWIYIDDAVDAYIKLAGSEETISVTGGWQCTVNQVVENIRLVTGGGIPVVTSNHRYEIEKQAFKHQIGTGITPFQDGIIKTINWYKRYLKV